MEFFCFSSNEGFKLQSFFPIFLSLSCCLLPFPLIAPNYIKDYACNYNKPKKTKKKVCWIFF